MRAVVATLAALLVFALFVALGVFLWEGGWWLQKANANKGYDVTVHTQGYQAGLISAERDRANAWTAATDPDQKALIKSTFCAVMADLTIVPADLAQDSALIGCS